MTQPLPPRHARHGVGQALVVTLLLGPLAALAPEHASADVKSTRHNFSTAGGLMTKYGGQRICVYCHTPHSKARSPKWDRGSSGRTYIKYWSPTLDAYGRGGAPPIDGASRLCLSCHDGTVALGQAGPLKVGSRTGSGIDLTGSHPISFRVTSTLIARNNAADMALKPLSAMKSDPDVKLDINDKIQCTTCHDPHSNKNGPSSGVPLYRKPTWDGVCLVCHEP